MGTEYFQASDLATAGLFNRVKVSGTTAVPGSSSHDWYGRVRYNGATWEVSTAHGAAGIETSMLSWNGGTNELDIDFTAALDYVSAPILVATPLNLDTAYNVKTGVTEAAGEFTGHIAFFNISTGVRITVESTDMDANLMITGLYI